MTRLPLDSRTNSIGKSGPSLHTKPVQVKHGIIILIAGESALPNLVRDLNERTIAKLKRRAERHNTSLQTEVKTILEESSRMDWAEFKSRADAFREKMIESGRTFSDSTELVREDRDR